MGILERFPCLFGRHKWTPWFTNPQDAMYESRLCAREGCDRVEHRARTFSINDPVNDELARTIIDAWNLPDDE